MFEFISDMHQRFRLARATERLEDVPLGDERAVIVIPGNMASDLHTVNLRLFLNEIGYNAYGWNCGVNFGYNCGWEDNVVTAAWQYWAATKQKVALIGWSLGGLQACRLAAAYPNLFEMVIAIGTPMSRLEDEEIPDRVCSIFSKDDPVVRWQESTLWGCDYVEVSGGHWALINNPDVYEAVAMFLCGAK